MKLIHRSCEVLVILALALIAILLIAQTVVNASIEDRVRAIEEEIYTAPVLEIGPGGYAKFIE